MPSGISSGGERYDPFKFRVDCFFQITEECDKNRTTVKTGDIYGSRPVSHVGVS